MTLASFTYCLPALLGYLLFVGISGRYTPHRVPARRVDRPSWGLGLWVALSVTAVVTAGVHVATTFGLYAAATLLAPGAWALTALLLPGLLAFFIYRAHVARGLEAEAIGRREAAFDSARILMFPTNERMSAADERSGTSPDDSSVVATFLDIDGPRRLDIPDLQVAVQDAPRGTDEPAIDTAIVANEAPDSAELRLALAEERGLREQTEKHLRVTRRALGRLESESREHEGDKTDALIALEEALESRIRDAASAESRATREAAARVDAETSVLSLKQDMLAARNRARRDTAARARAISTATRSVAFARQAVKARARIEAKLRETEEALANRDATVSSLIATLEKEKRRTDLQVNVLAKQLVLHEKQLEARRKVDEVARSVEGKLTSRLARKVARARPVVAGH